MTTFRSVAAVESGGRRGEPDLYSFRGGTPDREVLFADSTADRTGSASVRGTYQAFGFADVAEVHVVRRHGPQVIVVGGFFRPVGHDLQQFLIAFDSSGSIHTHTHKTITPHG